MKKIYYTLHRKLALWLAVPVVLWALSGVLHPVMANWLRPQIAHTFLPPIPVTSEQEQKAPAEVFSDRPELHQLKVIALDEKPVYLGITPNQALHYRDAITGEVIDAAVFRHVEQLARAYANDSSSDLLEIKEITNFSSTYSTINRLLPVYRVVLDRDDGLQVVVDPRTGRLATFDTPSKRLFSRLFSWFHTWSFLGRADSWLRITVVTLISGLSLLVSLSGVLSLVMMRRKRRENRIRVMKPARKWHRISGGVSAVFFLLFGVSGLAHVVAKYQYDDTTQWVSAQKVETERLSLAPASLGKPMSKVSLAVVDGRPYYRFGNRHGGDLISCDEAKIFPDGEKRYARGLALEFSRFPAESVKQIELITQFRNDYGFIFKRLPVWRVHYEGQSHWHDTVDTEDAHLAMRTSPRRLVEALSFTYLHKFHFLDFAGKNTRDVGTVVAVFLILMTVAFGVLSRKRRVVQERLRN